MKRLDTNNAIFQDIAAIHTSKLKYWSFGLAHLVSRFKPNRKFGGNFVKKSIQK